MVAVETLPSDLIDCAASSSAVDEAQEIADRAGAAGDAPVGEGDRAGDRQPRQRLQHRPHAGAGAHSLHAQLEDLLEVLVDALARRSPRAGTP